MNDPFDSPFLAPMLISDGRPLVNALARIRGVSSEREIAGALFDGEVVSPALCIDGFRFTSTTDF